MLNLFLSRKEKAKSKVSTLQVSQGPGYVLSVGGFKNSLSTLGDSLSYHNGMKFSTKLVKP